MPELGLIGYPLSHSWSPKIFNEFFLKENKKDYSYSLFPLKDFLELESIIGSRHELKGFNITIPYKQQILNRLDEMDISVLETGAVNTVVINRKSGIHLKGYNTDLYGFTESIRADVHPWHKKALILGKGGACKAVCAGLRKLGLNYTIVSRNPGPEDIGWDELDRDTVALHSLIINTTPLGMYPDSDNMPLFPTHYLYKEHLVYDLIYNPVKTKLLIEAEKAGAQIKNGLQMLELQAAKAWEIFKN